MRTRHSVGDALKTREEPAAEAPEPAPSPEPGRWIVQADGTNKVLAQADPDSTRSRFPVAVLSDLTASDVDLSVRFKPISGREDQAGGLIWRAKDANNYYVARANALENNVTTYDTVNGRRTERKRTRMMVAPNQWHTLRVDFQGTHFTVTLDGKNAIDWDDQTFKDAGKVGVWTKADSVTLFDDFTYATK